MKNLNEGHGFYVQTIKLLLGDVFVNFQNTRLEIYEVDLAPFLTAPELAWKIASKNKIVKQRSIN